MATLQENIKSVTEYLLAIERAGTPYRWWHNGDRALGQGPPAHAVDRPAPRPEEVDATFCAGLGNLALRKLGKSVPKLEPWNGGTGAWRRVYGPKMVPFSLSEAREGDVAFRPFNHGGVQDQGHWAYVGPHGKVIQSFAWNGATTEPGVTSRYTLAESHEGSYYVFLLRASDWLSPLPRKEKPPKIEPREKKPPKKKAPEAIQPKEKHPVKKQPEKKRPEEEHPEAQHKAKFPEATYSEAKFPEAVYPEATRSEEMPRELDGRRRAKPRAKAQSNGGAGELFTAKQLSVIVGSDDMEAMREHRAALLPEMEKGGITTPERIAAFLAEVGHETARLDTLEEYGDEMYFRSFLGDEWPYHGRGYIMLTWTGNYRAAGKAIGTDLVANPELVERPDVAAKTAVWFWNEHGLSSYADRGDIRAVSSVINTGRANSGNINGLADRLVLYERAREALEIGDRILPNLVAVGGKDEEAAHAAALVFRRRGFFVTTTVGSERVRSFDEVFSKEPVGTRQMIVVGAPALGALLPGSQRYVFNPYRPAKSDYIGAAGKSYEDTLGLLQELLEDHAGEGSGAEFREVFEAGEDAPDDARKRTPSLKNGHV